VFSRTVREFWFKAAAWGFTPTVEQIHHVMSVVAS